MFAARPHLAEKVLTVSCRPDSESEQLAALICGELFFRLAPKLCGSFETPPV
jgi:hypothetical protein